MQITPHVNEQWFEIPMRNFKMCLSSGFTPTLRKKPLLQQENNILWHQEKEGKQLVEGKGWLRRSVIKSNCDYFLKYFFCDFREEGCRRERYKNINGENNH